MMYPCMEQHICNEQEWEYIKEYASDFLPYGNAFGAALATSLQSQFPYLLFSHSHRHVDKSYYDGNRVIQGEVYDEEILRICIPTYRALVPKNAQPGSTIQVTKPDGGLVPATVPEKPVNNSSMLSKFQLFKGPEYIFVKDPVAERERVAEPTEWVTHEVAVPPNALPGMKMQFQLPDTSGLTTAIIPDGCTPGSTFTVRTRPPLPMIKIAAPSPSGSRWEVVGAGIHVRAAKDAKSDSLAIKARGSTVIGEKEGEWLRLIGEPGYIKDSGRAPDYIMPKLDLFPTMISVPTAKGTMITVLAKPGLSPGSVFEVKDPTLTNKD